MMNVHETSVMNWTRKNLLATAAAVALCLAMGLASTLSATAQEPPGEPPAAGGPEGPGGEGGGPEMGPPPGDDMAPPPEIAQDAADTASQNRATVSRSTPQPAAQNRTVATQPASRPAAVAPASAPSDLIPPPPDGIEPTTQQVAAATQATTGPTASQPTSRPRATNEPFTLNFRDASLRSVLEFFSEAAGLVIVEDTRAEGKVTLLSRQPITAEEAVALLDTVLRQKGYAAIRNGRTLKIVPLDQAKKELIPVRSGNDPKEIVPSDRVVTQIIPIRYADAIKLKADLASLIPASADVTSNQSSNTLIITDTESSIRKLVEIIQAIDIHMSEVSQVKVYQLKFANASNAAKLITDIFKEDTTSNQTNNQGGFGGGRRFSLPGFLGMGGQQQQTSDTSRRTIKVTASADDRTNTLVVSAPSDVLKVIDGVMKELDSNPAEQQAVFVYHLKNATATELESVLNNVFGTNSGSGGSSSSSSSRTNSSRTSSNSSRSSSSGLGSSSSSTGLGSNRNTSSNNNSLASSYRSSGSSPLAASANASTDLAGQVYVVADEDTNSLLVTTSTKNFDRVRAIIADLDRPVPQVLIKVLIAEVTHDNSLDLGVEFAGMNLRASGMGEKAGTNFGLDASGTGFVFTLNEENMTATIRALAGMSKLDVLSRPYILTGDNQEATIMVGKSIPIPLNAQTYDTGTTTSSIDYQDVGIILDVTPHINPDGLVTLDVYPEISQQTGETVTISDTFKAEVFAKRYAQSRVAIRDGQTIVIGGLMEDRLTKTVDKVPILGDIPILNFFFSHTVDTKTKTELLIFLTPHVALQPDLLKGMSEAEKAGTKIVQNSVEPGAYQEHLEGMERGAATKPAGKGSQSRPADNTMVTFPPATTEPKPPAKKE